MKYQIVFPESRGSSYSCEQKLKDRQNELGGFETLADLHSAIVGAWPNATFVTRFSALVHFEQSQVKPLLVFVMNKSGEEPRSRTYRIDRSPAEPPMQDLPGHYPRNAKVGDVFRFDGGTFKKVTP